MSMFMCVAGGKVLPQTKTLHGGWVQCWQTLQGITDQRELPDVRPAVGAGDEMQADADDGQDRKVVVEILRGSLCDVATGQSAVDPL